LNDNSMLDAWINRDDIERLIADSETINGLIERHTFIWEINNLKEYKKPKKKKRGVYFRDAMLNDIEKYREDVKAGKIDSCIERWLNETVTEPGYGETKIVKKREIWIGKAVEGWLKSDFTKDELIDIIPVRYLGSILKVSNRTLQRYREREIIIIDGDKEFIEYCKLSEIENNIKNSNTVDWGKKTR